jgi:hypothetical protein
MMETGKSLNLSIFPLMGKETKMSDLIGRDIFFEEHKNGKEGPFIHHLVLETYAPCEHNDEPFTQGKSTIRTIDMFTKQECYILVSPSGYFQVMLVSRSEPYMEIADDGGMMIKNLWTYNIPIEKSEMMMYYIAEESLI